MGKCKFSAIWLQDVKYREWLAGASNEFEVTCKMCQKTYKLGTMGIKAVESHMKSEATSSTPAGSQTNVGLNHGVQPSVSSSFFTGWYSEG